MAIAVVAAFSILLIPGRVRLPAALMFMPVWLTLGRLPDLGPVQALSKTTGFLLFAFVAFAAIVDPNPKRRIPGILWLYPAVTFFSPMWAFGSEEVALNFILNLQWGMLSLAAVLVARTFTSPESLRRVIFSLAFGSAIAMLILFASIIKSPGSIFRAGLGRFEPWGALSNHIGPLFIFGVPLLSYYGLRGRIVILRPVAIGCASIGALMALLTASRSAVFPLVIMMGVLGWEFRKKPVTMIVGAIAIVGALVVGSSLVSEANLGRLENLDSGRYAIFAEYIEAIAQSPLFGRLVVENAEAPGGTHAHNGYLEVLYQFGFVIGLPLFLLAAWSMVGVLRVWRKRRLIPLDPIEITLLCALMGVIYLHGATTLAIYYPTYSWAFIQVLLASFFISAASSPETALGALSTDEYHDPGDYHAYEYEQHDEDQGAHHEHEGDQRPDQFSDAHPHPH